MLTFLTKFTEALFKTSRSRDAVIPDAPMNEPMNASELAALKAAIEELPPKTKMALLRVQDGLSYEQVGAELKMRVWKVRRLVERAMKHLIERVS